jgi:hypothetical protein
MQTCTFDVDYHSDEDADTLEGCKAVFAATDAADAANASFAG